MPKPPPQKALDLVNALAAALCHYHNERHGNLGCYIQAVNILINTELLHGYQVMDFLYIQDME